MIKRLVCVIVSIAAGLFASTILYHAPRLAAAQDDRWLQWDRFDIIIDEINTTANRFDVTERYVITVIRGPFSFGTLELSLDRVDSISDFTVMNDDRPLLFSSGQDGDIFWVKYSFPQALNSGESLNIDLHYTVTGALRSYEKGDELYWIAIPGDHPFPIMDSTITVSFPHDVSLHWIRSYPSSWTRTLDFSQQDVAMIVWQAPEVLESGDEFAVRVEYAHNEQMVPPAWQTASRWDRLIEPIREILK